MKVALLPGGFKPPHLGHYNMAKYLADYADKVIVRIGQKERDGIGKELALEIWNFYKEFDSDSRAKKLTISVAQSPSPVKDVYDFVEKIAPEGSTIILGLGEKDASDGRYNSISKFAEPRNITTDIELVPPQAGGISGTRMREIIKANDKAEFFKYIPEYLPEEIKEEIWTKLQDTTLNERISFKSDISLDDIQYIDQQADNDMNPLDIDLTRQHFFDRLNDPRNYPNIELDELELFFTKLADKKEEFIEFLNQYKQIVAKDKQTNINIPFMKVANKAIAKTIMRKSNFQSSNPTISLEELYKIPETFSDFFNKNNQREINEDIMAYGDIHEFNLDLNNSYDYSHNGDFWVFYDDKNNLDIYVKIKTNRDFKEFKFYPDPKSGIGFGKLNHYNPKNINTIFNILLNEVLPKYPKILIQPADNIRYRLFKALINNNLSKDAYNIYLSNNDDPINGSPKIVIISKNLSEIDNSLPLFKESARIKYIESLKKQLLILEKIC